MEQPEQLQRSPRNKIESIKIRGFRSLADVELSDMPDATVLIGPNGGGKSNLFRFFEMLGWMFRSRKLAEYVALQGGADDQLYGGNRVTPRMEAEIAIRTRQGLNDYRIALTYAHPDRFIITEEAYRFSRTTYGSEAPWINLDSGAGESRAARGSGRRGELGQSDCTGHSQSPEELCSLPVP